MRKINFSLGVGNRNTGTKKNLFAMLNLHRNMTNRLILEQVPLFPVPAGRLAQSVDCVKKKVASQKIKRYLYHLHHGHEKG